MTPTYQEEEVDWGLEYEMDDNYQPSLPELGRMISKD
jgi:hypothetical protein